LGPSMTRPGQGEDDVGKKPWEKLVLHASSARQGKEDEVGGGVTSVVHMRKPTVQNGTWFRSGGTPARPSYCG